jgi:hypothetical protein
MGAAAGIIGGLNTVGETATLPNVLSLFFGGMAAGAGLVAAIRKGPRSRSTRDTSPKERA